MRPERDEPVPPLGTGVRRTRSAGGVTLDFPKPRSAGDAFAFQMFLSVSASLFPCVVLFFAAAVYSFGADLCSILGFVLPLGLVFAPALYAYYRLFTGVTSLAAQRTRRIAVFDGVLLHTTYGGAKEVWRRDEIVGLGVETYEAGGRYPLGVFVRYGRDDKFLLYGAIPHARPDDTWRDELNWIAAELNRALGLPDNDAAPADPIAEAVKEKSSPFRPRE